MLFDHKKKQNYWHNVCIEFNFLNQILKSYNVAHPKMNFIIFQTNDRKKRVQENTTLR